jgi:hypothetical protein
MIEIIGSQSDGFVEARATGRITGADYDDVLVPAIEEAIAAHGRVRVLCHLGADFERFGLDAAWDDTRLGLRHWNGFERIAIVTDSTLIRGAVRAFSFALPCPVATFADADLDGARRWLRESLGTIHLDFDQGQRLVRAQLMGKLEPSAYRDVAEEIDSFMAEANGFRLLLDLRDFDGWESLSAIREHLTLVRDHYRALERVAIVSDSAWTKLAAGFAEQLAGVDARHFEASELPAAEKWLVSGG